MKTQKSNKELDLIDLGLCDAYRACYFFACSGICLIFGLTLSCISSAYESLAAFLVLLLIGLFLVASSLVLLPFGFVLLKKERKASENYSLRCPIQAKKIIKNGYIVSGFLGAVGIIVLIVGSLFFPGMPIHGTALLLGSFVVLFYASLLLISTIRDQMIAKATQQ